MGGAGTVSLSGYTRVGAGSGAGDSSGSMSQVLSTMVFSVRILMEFIVVMEHISRVISPEE